MYIIIQTQGERVLGRTDSELKNYMKTKFTANLVTTCSYFCCILLLKCLKSAPCIARMDTSHDVKPMPSAMEGR
jgi:hypothetical protein